MKQETKKEEVAELQDVKVELGQKTKEYINDTINYFKYKSLIFLSILILANIAFFYFFDGIQFILVFIIGNIILSWGLIFLFIFLTRIYIAKEIAKGMEFAKEELEKYKI